MSLVGFTLLGTIEVPSITGAATGVPLLVKPNTEFTVDMLAKLDSGGGDLRFGTEDGLTQYPCEIVDGLNIVWMTPTGLSVASAATVGVWGNNTGVSQPAVGAAFGRDAVWVDCEYASHDGLIDITGKHTPTQVGTTLVTGPFGNAGGAREYNSRSSDLIYVAGLSFSPPFTLTSRANILDDGLARIITVADAATTDHQVNLSTYFGDGVAQAIRLFASPAGSTLAPASSASDRTQGVWRSYAARITSSTDRKVYLNGGDITGVSTTSAVTNTLTRLALGVSADSTPFGDQPLRIAEPRLYLSAVSDDQVSIEYDNQSTTGSWWIAADAGGGIVIAPTSIPSGESFGTPTIATGVVIIFPVAIPTQESVGSPTILKELFISPVTIPSEEAVGDPVIELILQQIFPNGIPTEEFVGRPIVLGGDSIVIPVLSRQTWNAVAKYLRDLVFKGHDNDVIVAWLRSEGFEDGAYNDLWYDYLLQKGFIDGSLTDKYAAWRQDIAGDDPWILSSGSWNDNKIWRDNENWKDS